jgi:hypothetical protein
MRLGRIHVGPQGSTGAGAQTGPLHFTIGLPSCAGRGDRNPVLRLADACTKEAGSEEKDPAVPKMPEVPEGCVSSVAGLMTTLMKLSDWFAKTRQLTIKKDKHTSTVKGHLLIEPFLPARTNWDRLNIF